MKLYVLLLAACVVGCIGPKFTGKDGEEVADTAIKAAACNQEALIAKQFCLDNGGPEQTCKNEGWDAYTACKKEKGLPQ